MTRLALVVLIVIAGAALGAGLVWLGRGGAPNPRVAALVRGYEGGDSQIAVVVRDDRGRGGPD